MKMGSLKGLLYRELTISKTSMIKSAVSSSCFILLYALAIISYKFGNLAKFEFDPSYIKNALTLIPVFTVCILCFSVTEGTIADIKPLWEKFRKSTPASCSAYALAKYVLLALCAVFSAVISFALVLISDLAFGTAFSFEEMAAPMIILTLCIFIGVLSQNLITALKSVDKGMIASMVVMVVLISPFIRYIITVDESTTADALLTRFGAIQDFCLDLFPFVPVIIIAVLAAGFFATTMLYKRREK
ncbi:MAG: hypothetical protein ACI4J1_07455 [Ruminiclostridium sp.]